MQGSIVSAIGRGINAIISAIAAVIETIVSAIVSVCLRHAFVIELRGTYLVIVYRSSSLFGT